MFLAPLAAALLIAPQFSPVTATFGTPAMVLRSDWFELTPDGKFATDGITWIDLATEQIAPRSIRIIKEDLRTLLAEDKWVGYTLLANENWVRFDTEQATLLNGKTGEVLSVVDCRVSAIDPTGRLVARGASLAKDKRAVQVANWPRSGEKPKWRTLVEHNGDMEDGTFDITGAYLAWHESVPETTEDDDVYVHDLKAGKTVHLKVEDDSLSTYTLALAPGGKTVAVVRRHQTHLFDVTSGKLLRTVPHPSRGFDEMSPTATFTPDGEAVLVSGLELRRIERFPRDPKLKPDFIDVSDGDSVYGFAITPDSKRIVVRDQGGVIRVYDLATGKRLDRGTHDTWQGVMWAGDNKAVCWSDRGRVVIWDTHTGKIERQLTLGLPVEKSRGVSELILSPDGKLAAVTEDLIDGGFALSVFDFATGKVIWELPSGISAQAVRFHPDGDKIGVGTIDFREPNWGSRRFRVYDLNGKKELRAHPWKTWDCQFNDDGRSVFEG